VLIAWWIPKRLPAHENYVIWWFTAAFALLFDLLVGATFDLYDYGASEKVGLVDLAAISTANPAIAIVLLNYWPKRRGAQLCYALAAIAVLFANELVWLKLGYLKFKGWTLWYSLLSYPVLFSILHLNLYFYRRLLKRA
jgi:hypothetical protein